MENALAIIRNVSLFQDLDDAQLEKVAGISEERSYKTGEYLFRENEPHRSFFILCGGEVEIFRQVGEERISVARLGGDNFLGEGAMLDDLPHTTSCLAEVRTPVLVFSRPSLVQLFDNEPQAASRILAQVARAIAYRVRTANLSFHGTPEVVYGDGRQRMEHDLLGDREVPTYAYYGVQTLRAMENFRITGITLRSYPNFIKALAMVKKAAAMANRKLDNLDPTIADAICAACDEIIAGGLHNQFVVDMIQGGAGTSTNMNANEVIANRALELLGHAKGEYQYVHPNNHVNLSQSTNDAYPTAIRLAILLSYEGLIKAMDNLCYELKQKAIEFSRVIKMGRTQLQDAVPMTLGQEFDAFYATVKEDIDRIREMARLFQEINMGATAIGTGINTDPDYASLVTTELSRILGTDLKLATNLVEAT
jgi:aspartate ammonia-lyase